ncbi:DUF4124 domain-containing protein [Desulfonema ishimotonii]|uniref:DUF4124 domain-containing protein n=1 Tax=Desulfonema ishimotonii TaxID=45657 RepID=A0A401G048_9BACT|nr:DUF4124 domain-containing protein [Desulfonema ishimotonii]GBC62588.1 DUF4124 domain-containing protein [Desulfonema ishimotonii]
MKNIIVFWASLIIGLCTVPGVHAELYLWTDENGVKHYSNEPPPPEVQSFEKTKEDEFDPDADHMRILKDRAWRRQEKARIAEEKKQREAEAKAKSEAAERLAEERRKKEEEKARLAEEAEAEKKSHWTEENRRKSKKSVYVRPAK